MKTNYWYLIKLLELNISMWNHLTVCKQMCSDSFKNDYNFKQFIYKSYIYVYKQDLASNNPQGLIYHKTQTKLI